MKSEADTTFAPIKHLLWEVDISSLDLDKHAEFIQTRILERGTKDDLKWLFSHYDKDDVIKTIISTRQISPRTAYFWQAYFNIKEPIRCLQQSYRSIRKTHWKN